MRKSNFFFICTFLLIFGCYNPPQNFIHDSQSLGSTKRMTPVPVSVHSREVKKELIFQRLVRVIKSYIGTPYQYGGSTQRGIDCSGLVMKIYQKALGLRLPHSTTSLAKLGIPLSVRNLKFGDLLFFRTSRSKKYSHVGIYLYKTKFVHSSSSRGVVISDFSEEKYYRKNFVEARRLVNLW